MNIGWRSCWLQRLVRCLSSYDSRLLEANDTGIVLYRLTNEKRVSLQLDWGRILCRRLQTILQIEALEVKKADLRTIPPQTRSLIVNSTDQMDKGVVAKDDLMILECPTRLPRISKQVKPILSPAVSHWSA